MSKKARYQVQFWSGEAWLLYSPFFAPGKPNKKPDGYPILAQAEESAQILGRVCLAHVRVMDTDSGTVASSFDLR